MERNFSRSLNAVLAEEGGWANHPKDPGGPTMKGVTLASFKRYVKPDATEADLRALTNEQAGVIYRRFYWDEVMGAELPDGIDLAIFDFAVNSGPGRAAKTLQTIVGAKTDGKIGPETIKAVKAADPDMVIDQIFASRRAFLERLPTFPTFGKGWTARLGRILKLSLDLAAQPANAPVVVEKQVEVAVPVEVAVVPKGADKRGSSWLVGAIGILSAPLSAFFALDTTTKLIIGALTILAFAFFLFRGELIIGRIKKLVAEIDG